MINDKLTNKMNKICSCSNFQDYIGFVSASSCSRDKEIVILDYQEKIYYPPSEVIHNFIDSLLHFVNFKSMLFNFS